MNVKYKIGTAVNTTCRKILPHSTLGTRAMGL